MGRVVQSRAPCGSAASTPTAEHDSMIARPKLIDSRKLLKAQLWANNGGLTNVQLMGGAYGEQKMGLVVLRRAPCEGAAANLTAQHDGQRHSNQQWGFSRGQLWEGG